MPFREHGPTGGDTRDLSGGNNFPKIFQLIDAKATVQEIVQQIYADFYSSDRDPEKLFLGFQELLMRGSEGEAVLRFISQDKGELGQLASKLLSEPPADDDGLEQQLGIDRKSGFLDVELTFRNVDGCKVLYQKAIDLGIFHGEFLDFVNHLKEAIYTKSSGHSDASIEKEVMCKSVTFGQSEVAYLSLLGSRKILETRALNQPKLLLLGSLMQYSAREFSFFAKKLNQSAKPIVMDVNPDCLKACSKYQGENDLQVVPGDALDIPMLDNSIDQIYTNHLFHFLVTHDIGSSTQINIENISTLFNEVGRVLKPGGSFLIEEQPYGIYSSQGDAGMKAFFKVLQSYAARAGFKVARKMDNLEGICFRPQIINVDKGISGVKIDDNGFPHYKDIVVLNNSNSPYATFRFEKNK